MRYCVVAILLWFSVFCQAGFPQDSTDTGSDTTNPTVQEPLAPEPASIQLTVGTIVNLTETSEEGNFLSEDEIGVLVSCPGGNWIVNVNYIANGEMSFPYTNLYIEPRGGTDTAFTTTLPDGSYRLDDASPLATGTDTTVISNTQAKTGVRGKSINRTLSNRATGCVEVQQFFLRALVDEYCEAGNYEGDIELELRCDDGRWAKTRFRYCCCIKDWLSVELSNDMDFASMQPGEEKVSNCTVLTVKSNMKCWSIRGGLSSLMCGNNTFPTSQMALAMANTAADAVNIASGLGQGSYGDVDFTWTERGKGCFKKYFCAKAKVEMSNPPGEYRGQFTVNACQ